MTYAVNCCRFKGRLHSFELKTVGEEAYLLGKGVLFLQDNDVPFAAGQYIKFNIWGDNAVRMGEVEIGTWIHMLSSYMPSEFRGQLQDYFTVTSFQVL